MKSATKIVVGLVVVIVVVWAGVYFSKDKGTETETPEVAKVALGETVKIGFIAPFTGDAAAYGEPLQKVAQLAVDEINASGGINGKTKIEMIFEDGACNGKDASNAMQKLVNIDKVKVVLGAVCSGASLAAVPIAEQNKVLLFSAAASSPDLTGVSPYFFRNYPSDATQGQVMANVAYSNKGWKNVAMIQEQLDYPLGFRKAFEDKFKEMGGETTLETFSSEVKDFRTILTKLKATSPDALLISIQAPAAAERILQQVKELEWDVNLIGIDVIPGSDIPATSPDLVEGMIAAEFGYDSESSEWKKFDGAYQEKFGEEIEYKNYSQCMYDAVYVLADALAANGEDADAMVDWLNNLKGWKGVSGINEFAESGDRAVGGHRPEVIEGGEVKLFDL